MVSDPVALITGNEHAGKRLDKVLAELTGYSRRHLRILFSARCVRVEGRTQAASYPARAGEQIVILALPTALLAQQPEPPALRVVSCTESVVIVDKPAGQPSVPLPHRPALTLADLLVRHYPEMRDVGYGPSEAGLIHRLDTQTSGLMIAARTASAFSCLQQALKLGQIEKRYYAVVPSNEALLRPEVVVPLKPHPHNRRRVMVCSPLDERGKPARTVVSLVQRGARFMLLDIAAPRAYRHQIRAHLSHLGLPLAGDVLYGGTRVPELGARHALHAHMVAWPGNDQLDGFRAHSEPPGEFVELLTMGSS